VYGHPLLQRSLVDAHVRELPVLALLELECERDERAVRIAAKCNPLLLHSRAVVDGKVVALQR